MKIPQLLTSCAACMLCVCSARAALPQQITPGLWETKSKMGDGSGELQEAMAMMQQQLAGMAPQQRAKIDAMLASQGVAIGGDGVIAHVCITPEMASQQRMPIAQARGSCTYQQATMLGNTLHYAFSCTNPQGSGNGTATFSGSTNYTSRTRVTTSATGASETVTVASSGRWLGSDCGNVKPLVSSVSPLSPLSPTAP